MTSSPIAGLLGLVVALGAAPAATAQEGLPPVEVADREAMDPEIAALIAEHVAQVEAHPANGEAHARLGLVYEANTLFLPAASCYENAIALLPDRPEWVYRLALMQHAGGAVDEALASMARAADAMQDAPVVHARHGQMLFLAGRMDESALAWERAIAAEASQPRPVKWPESRVGLAQVWMEQERFEEAARLLRQALRLNPRFRHAHYLLGLCYFELGRDDEAELELTKGVNSLGQRFPADPHQALLNEYSVGFHRRMAGIVRMLRAGDAASANATLQEILQQDPNNHVALNMLARVYSMTGDLDSELATLRASDTADPGVCATKIELAKALIKKVNGLQARSRAAPVSDPAERQALQARHARLMDEILATARAGAELAPTLGLARYYHGLALFLRVDPQQPDRQTLQSAVDELSAALTLGCRELRLFEYLSRGHQMLGQTEQMITFAEAHVGNFPDQPGSYLFLANARFMVDDRAGALAAVKRALALAPDSPQVTTFADQLEAAIAQRERDERRGR